MNIIVEQINGHTIWRCGNCGERMLRYTNTILRHPAPPCPEFKKASTLLCRIPAAVSEFVNEDMPDEGTNVHELPVGQKTGRRIYGKMAMMSEGKLIPVVTDLCTLRDVRADGAHYTRVFYETGCCDIARFCLFDPSSYDWPEIRKLAEQYKNDM